MLVNPRYQAAQYDGGNGAAVAQDSGTTLLADDGTVLQLGLLDGRQYDLYPGQWLVWRVVFGATQPVGVLDDPDFQQQYIQAQPL